MDVFIEEGRIAWLAVTGERVPIGAHRLHDAGESILTPGLIDGHVHLSGTPGLPEDDAPASIGLREVYRRQAARSFLYHGFTAVVDLNHLDRDDIAWFSKQPLHPDIFHCGTGITMANGYPMVWLPENERLRTYSNYVVDETVPDGVDAAAHSPDAAVGRIVESGAVATKLFWESGFGRHRDLPTPSHEMVAEIVALSGDAGLPVIAHANSYSAHRFLAGTDIDMTAHGIWNWRGLEAETGVPPEIGEVLDAYVARDIGLMPTMRVVEGLRDMFHPAFLDAPALAKVLPDEVVAWYATEPAGFLREEIRADDFGGVSDEAAHARFGVVADQGARVVRAFLERGGRLVFGSDTPSAPTYGNPPGLNGYLELRALAAAGVPLEQLFVTATLGTARAFRLEGYGDVKSGYVANLLLLEESPLDSVDAWNSIEFVIQNGALVERETLAASE